MPETHESATNPYEPELRAKLREFDLTERQAAEIERLRPVLDAAAAWKSVQHDMSPYRVNRISRAEDRLLLAVVDAVKP